MVHILGRYLEQIVKHSIEQETPNQEMIKMPQIQKLLVLEKQVDLQDSLDRVGMQFGDHLLQHMRKEKKKKLHHFPY
eukprot:Gb_09050 [translate_table: standard]